VILVIDTTSHKLNVKKYIKKHVTNTYWVQEKSISSQNVIHKGTVYSSELNKEESTQF